MMSGALEHRAAKISLVNGLSTVLGMASQLVSVPVCLHYWGKEAYGTWLALFAAFTLLRSLDGGFVTYVGNELNVLYHRDVEALREHLSAAVVGVAILGALELLLAVGTLLIHPLSDALGMPAGRSGVEAHIGLIVLMSSWVLTGAYLGIIHRLQIPAGLMYQAAWWAMAFQLAQFGAIMVAAVMRLDMLRTSTIFAAVQFAIFVASGIYIRRKLPRFYPWLRGRPQLRLGLSDLSRSLLLTGSNIIQQSTGNGSVLLISGLAGPVAVPVFTTVRTLVNLWTAVTTVLSGPLLPEVVRIHATGEVHKLAAINGVFWVLVGSAVNMGSLLCYPLVPLLYGAWTAHAVVLDRPLLCLMLGSVVVTNSGALMALHVSGINRLRVVLATSVVRAAFALGGGMVAYRYIGLAGFGLGILAGEVAATAIITRQFLRHEIADVESSSLSAAFGPVILGTGSALVFFVGAALGWWDAIGWCLAVAGVAAAFTWGWNTMDGELRRRLTALAATWRPWA